jgi:FkbM family methyltransferase
MILTKFFLKKIYWEIAKKIGFSILFRDECPSMHSQELKLYKTLIGKYFLSKYSHQDVIKKKIIKNRVFDEEVFELSKKYVKPNSIVLDLGANYGQMSILYPKLFSDTVVYSFEASKYIFDILKKNVELNSKNIKTFNYVISDRGGEEHVVLPNFNKYGTYGSVEVEFSNDKEKTYEKKTLIKKMKYNLNDFINFFKDLDYVFLTAIKNNYLVVPKSEI